MFTKILLPFLAICGVCLAVFTVMAENKDKPLTPPVVQPAAAPFVAYVAGAGLVEPRTENISIGTHVAGIITRVHIQPGEKVAPGQPLFTIDDRTVRSDLTLRQALLDIASARLERLKSEPRQEDVPPVQARVDADKSVLDDLSSQLAMWEKADRRAVADEEVSKRRFAVMSAKARLAESTADLTKLQAGAWKPDLDVAAAEVDSARAQLEAIRVEVERHTVTAPVAAEILKIDARPGEFAPAGADKPLITLGDTSTLHVRVDVDENDAWRVKAGSPGKAYVRGNPALHTDLKFVRFEPYVIPKRSLTGASTERVDTRVLQVIYSFDPKTLAVFVGQQMDVFIDAPSSAAAAQPQASSQETRK